MDDTGTLVTRLRLSSVVELLMATKLLVADDHEVIRAGIRTLVEDVGIEIIGEAATGNEAVRLVPRLKPDVVLLDVRMPDGDGLNALGRIRLDQSELPILMYSTYDNPTYVARAYALDANGYVLKSAGAKKLIDAILAVAQGGTVWTRKALRRITAALATPRLKNDVEVPLTLRESEVLRHVALGSTNKEIASSLHISYETVKEHVQHILRKIGVADRTQAAVWAVRKGLV